MFLASKEVEKNFYRKGETVFTEGDEGDGAFIVEMGSVEIYKRVEGETVRLATMTEGELFGEMAVIDGSSRMANARVIEDSVIIHLPRKLFESKLGKTDPFIKSLVQMLLDNLRNVHKAYMRRPRSAEDYINAMDFHRKNFAGYLQKAEQSNKTTQLLKEIEVIEKSLASIKKLTRDQQDVRSSVFEEHKMPTKAHEETK